MQHKAEPGTNPRQNAPSKARRELMGTMAQLDAFIPDWPEPRLTRAHRQVKDLLSDGLWHSVREISVLVGCNEAAAGARARDCRKARYGGLTIECKRFGKGLWRYRWVR